MAVVAAVDVAEAGIEMNAAFGVSVRDAHLPDLWRCDDGQVQCVEVIAEHWLANPHVVDRQMAMMARLTIRDLRLSMRRAGSRRSSYGLAMGSSCGRAVVAAVEIRCKRPRFCTFPAEP